MRITGFGRLQILHSERFLRELHHLLWTEPAAGGAVVDGGWNCRDHAWVTALLALSMHHDAMLVSGEALFALGPNDACGSASFSVTPHSWAYVAGMGAVDLSVKPAYRVDGHDVGMPMTCIFAGSTVPRAVGTVCFLADRAQYAMAVEELPRRANEFSIAYLLRCAERLDPEYLTRAAGWIGSHLTCRLDDAYGNPSDIYCALFLHLRGLLDGTRASLVNLSFADAWRRIAAERDGAIDRALAALPEAFRSASVGSDAVAVA